MKLKGKVTKTKVTHKKVKEYRPAKESSFKINEVVYGVKMEHIPPKKEWTMQNRQMQTNYGKFLLKYDDLDNTIDDFSVTDILYYFREVAKEHGFKYMLNFSKESGQIKRMKEVYSNREICGMIEFLYDSDQDYLEKDRLSIGLLCSQWVNTIYADFNLWLEDEYVPGSKKNRSQNNKHEWKSSNDARSSVGEW